MEDNYKDVESTEVVSDREPAELSIRETLSKQLKQPIEKEGVEESVQEAQSDASSEVASVPQEAPQVAYAPPADMNKFEKEAFLTLPRKMLIFYNPT